jgi:hypothetical protein
MSRTAGMANSMKEWTKEVLVHGGLITLALTCTVDTKYNMFLRCNVQSENYQDSMIFIYTPTIRSYSSPTDSFIMTCITEV